MFGETFQFSVDAVNDGSKSLKTLGGAILGLAMAYFLTGYASYKVNTLLTRSRASVHPSVKDNYFMQSEQFGSE